MAKTKPAPRKVKWTLSRFKPVATSNSGPALRFTLTIEVPITNLEGAPDYAVLTLSGNMVGQNSQGPWCWLRRDPFRSALINKAGSDFLIEQFRRAGRLDGLGLADWTDRAAEESPIEWETSVGETT